MIPAIHQRVTGFPVTLLFWSGLFWRKQAFIYQQPKVLRFWGRGDHPTHDRSRARSRGKEWANMSEAGEAEAFEAWDSGA
jgi:hypothetical protein